jgi:hypothetical protein
MEQMAEIPTKLLDELTEEINKFSEQAQEQVKAALKVVLDDWVKNGNGDIAALREITYEVIENELIYFADTCAAAQAANFYDDVRKSQNVSGSYSALAESRRDPAATLGAVRYFVGQVADGNVDTFVSLCLSRVDTEIRRAANKCVAYNVGKDPAKPRYARVPRGDTCGFCLMLAAFGFHYKTEEAASHAHSKCDCKIVPGFDGKTTVKGYNPEAMYKSYNACLKTLGGNDGIAADWYALPKAERDAYIKAHGNKEGKAYQAYKNKRMAAEIETRDPDWFKTNEKKPEPSYQTKRAEADLNKIEQDTRDILKNNGFNQFILERSSEQNVKTADLRIGNGNGVLADYKCPRGTGFNCIDNLARDTGKKASIMVLYLNPEESTISSKDCIKYFKQCASRRHVDEMLLIDYDKTVIRVLP